MSDDDKPTDEERRQAEERRRALMGVIDSNTPPSIMRDLVSIDDLKLLQKPEPKPSVLDKYPIGATSVIVAAGGVGKTQYLVRDALRFAANFDGYTLIISAEDTPDDYAAKIHNMLLSPTENGNGDRYPDVTLEALRGRIKIANMRGLGRKLVANVTGIPIPSNFATEITVALCDYMPDVKLVFIETLSRFSGGETNEHFEAAVTACDGIAQTANVAVVLIHHIGKSASREKIVDLYTGRGGSVLGDNTRSMIALTPLSLKTDKHDAYLGDGTVDCTNEEIQAGIIFEAKHVRYSYGRCIDSEYFKKLPGYAYAPVLQTLKTLNGDDALDRQLKANRAKADAAASMICKIIKKEGGRVSVGYFEKADNRKAVGLSRTDCRDTINDMISAGSIERIEVQEYTGGGLQKVFYFSLVVKGSRQ